MATVADMIQSYGYLFLANFDYEHWILIYTGDFYEIDQKRPINLDLF